VQQGLALEKSSVTCLSFFLSFFITQVVQQTTVISVSATFPMTLPSNHLSYCLTACSVYVPQIKISDVNCALWFMKACSSLGGYQSF
jgi:hypothetical protein